MGIKSILNPFESRKIQEAKDIWDNKIFKRDPKNSDKYYKTDVSFWKKGEDPDDASYKYGNFDKYDEGSDAAGHYEVEYEDGSSSKSTFGSGWLGKKIPDNDLIESIRGGSKSKTIYTEIMHDPLFKQLEKGRKIGAITGSIAGGAATLPLALKLADKICKKYNIEGKKAKVLKVIMGLLGGSAGAYGGAQLGGYVGEKIGQKVWDKRFSNKRMIHKYKMSL